MPTYLHLATRQHLAICLHLATCLHLAICQHLATRQHLPICAYLFISTLSASSYPLASACLYLPICATLIRSLDRIVYSIRWLVVIVWL